MSSRCDFAQDDGAYVLGALSPEDRQAFERHLDGCDDCSRSVRELAGLPGLLARIPVEVVEAEGTTTPTPVPGTLLPALVRRARRTERRRAWLYGGIAAAAAAVAIAAVTVATAGDDSPVPSAGSGPATAPSTAPTTAPTTAAAEPFVPVGAEPLSGWLSLTSVGWGTRLDLTCSYAERDERGGPADAYRDEGGPTYRMVVTHSDGSTEQVASWRALPGKTMRLAAATAAARADIASVAVLSSTGKTLLTLDG